VLQKIEIPEAFEFLFQPARLKVLFGGRGGGKSESIARYLLITGAQEPMNILCAREFQNSIRESVHQLLADIIRQYNLESFYDVLNTEIRGKNGTRFFFAGLRHNINNIKSIPNIKRCWCFVAGTKVDGKPIESIKVGDFVHSYNHQSGKIERRRVANIFKNIRNNDLYKLLAKDGRISILATSEHPIYVKGKGYIPICDILPNDVIYEKVKPTRVGFMQRRVDSVEIQEQTDIEQLGLSDGGNYVYNIEVEVNNNYFANSVLVHNCEEAETVSEHSWKILIPTIRGENSEIIVSFNPDIAESPTYKRMVVNAPDYAVVKKVTYRDNPYFPAVLEQERVYMQEKDPTGYDNVWEGNPKAAVEGAVFAKQLAKIEEEGRIKEVPYEPNLPVYVFADLGRGDKTSLWFVQYVGLSYNFIDYYENNGEHFSHYIKVLKEKPYSYATIYLPHDAANETIAAEKSVEAQARSAFSSVVIVPRVQKKHLSIDAAMSIFPMAVFDAEKCADGLMCLRMYAYKKDVETGKTSKEPEHDTPWSHGADAFQQVALVRQMQKKKPVKAKQPTYGWQKKLGSI